MTYKYTYKYLEFFWKKREEEEEGRGGNEGWCGLGCKFLYKSTYKYSYNPTYKYTYNLTYKYLEVCRMGKGNLWKGERERGVEEGTRFFVGFRPGR